jgi:hypothetical protein
MVLAPFEDTLELKYVVAEVIAVQDKQFAYKAPISFALHVDDVINHVCDLGLNRLVRHISPRAQRKVG